MKSLREKSESRTSGAIAFDLINQNAKRLKRQRDATILSLQLTEFRADESKMKDEVEDIREKQKVEVEKYLGGLNVIELSESSIESSDSVAIARQENFHKSIKKDIYLFEAMSVLEDMEL